MSEQHDVSARVAALEQEVAALRQERRRRAQVRWVLVGALVATVAVAQTVPSFTTLRFFSENTPAVASDVNGNLDLLRRWIEQKAGPVGTSNVTMANATATSLISGSLTTNTLDAGVVIVRTGLVVGTNTTSGQTHLRGDNTQGNLHLDASRTGATYLNWYSGSGGFVVGNGSSSTSIFRVAGSGDVTTEGRFIFRERPGQCGWASGGNAAWGQYSEGRCPVGQYAASMRCVVRGAAESPAYTLTCETWCCWPG